MLLTCSHKITHIFYDDVVILYICSNALSYKCVGYFHTDSVTFQLLQTDVLL